MIAKEENLSSSEETFLKPLTETCKTGPQNAID